MSEICMYDLEVVYSMNYNEAGLVSWMPQAFTEDALGIGPHEWEDIFAGLKRIWKWYKKALHKTITIYD